MDDNISEIMIIEDNDLDHLICESAIKSVDPKVGLIFSKRAMAALSFIKIKRGKISDLGIDRYKHA